MNSIIPHSSVAFTTENVKMTRKEKILYYRNESGPDSSVPVNVGTIGHIDWGRQGYQPDLTQFVSNMPYREVRSLNDVWLTDTEVFEAWCGYIRATEGINGDFSIAKLSRNGLKKEDQPYLGFENGGLIVGGKVIWILPDKEYAKFHKRAAEWVLPSKEYVKQVVRRYFGILE